jgi:hypothetical protein
MTIKTKLEIRKITPPKLDAVHIGQKILCSRPMRRRVPNMSIEKRGNKIIAHNYGHGGSGWTLGPGSAAYVNNLLLKNSEDLSKISPITIIGAGVIGLFTAYDLVKRGFKNITIIADKFDFLVSHNAGGLLAPVSMDNAPQMQNLVDQIGIDAYKFYELIAKNKHQDFKIGAVITPAYFKTREESGLEPYVGEVMQPAKDVILDFGNGTNREMVVYDDGIFIDTARMMSSLRSFLDENQVVFEKKKIHNFAEINSKFIINCTSFGSESLNHDSEMVPVQGHLIMLKDQNPQDLQYMLLVYFGEDQAKSGHKVKRSFYIFPKHPPGSGKNDIGVIGGTFIEGATNETPNVKEFEIVVEDAKKFYGI